MQRETSYGVDAPRHDTVSAARLVVATATVVSLHLFAPAASAQEPWPALVLRGGALIVDLSSDVRVDATIGNFGTSIDLENALGFNTGSKTFFVDGTWRISRRNQLQVDYEQIDRDVSHSILSNPIIFHNTIFDRSATVDAFFDSRYLSAYYGFAFVATPSVELGVSIGVTLVRLHAGVGLSGGTSDTTVSRDLTEETKFDVPVPLPGFFVNVRPHPRVTLIGSTRLLKITINKISASMVEAKAGAEVKLVGPLGVGGTYYYNRISAERDESDPNGKIVYSFNGPQVYGILAF
jgi:hypothetical protein